MVKNLRKFTKSDENLNPLTQNPDNNSSQEFNPPNGSDYVPLATPRSTVHGILTTTTTVKNTDVFEKLILF